MSNRTFLLLFRRGLVSSVMPTTSLAVPTTCTYGKGAKGQRWWGRYPWDPQEGDGCPPLTWYSRVPFS